MQELVYQHGIHDCFNHNIEILRDIAEIVGIGDMVNAYDNISWGITEGGRIAIMITDRRYRFDFHGVIVEFQGDGCCSIYNCDQYGKVIDDGNYTTFDTHSYICKPNGANRAFKNILQNQYDVYY
jgi:hypothetical protein